MVLSHPTTHTTASNNWPRQTSSIESAIISRLTSEARIPSVPMVSPSLMAIVLNYIGVPPAARMPSFTFAASGRNCKLQGIVSIQVLATPTSGLLRSLSVKPIALNIARAGARSRPSVMPRLRCLRSIESKCKGRPLQKRSRCGFRAISAQSTPEFVGTQEPAKRGSALSGYRLFNPWKLCQRAGSGFARGDGRGGGGGGRSPSPAVLRKLLGSTCADINHIHYRMPITRKLPNLLGIHVEQQSDLVPLVDRFCLHVRHLDAAPRNRGENPHQRPLGVAIEDVKDLHGR